MLILAVSDLKRNPAAAIFNGQTRGPLAAIEEAKLERNRSDDGLPRLAIDFCLREAGARLQDVGAVAVAGRPKREWVREENLRRALLPAPAARRSQTNGTRIPARLRDHQRLRQLFGREVGFYSFEHHLCHAASAFYASEFDRSLILTLDGAGDMWSGLLAIGEGEEIRQLRPLQFPDSLGWLYAQVTELIGFEAGRDEHKTQWLSSRGTSDYLGMFKRFFARGADGIPVFDRQYLGRDTAGTWRLAPGLIPQSSADASDRGTNGAATIARSVQDFLEQEVVAVAEHYRRLTGARHLCLAGGVFLNPLLVRALERDTGFAGVFVQPAADNSGTAIGVGYLARKQLAGTCGRTPLRDFFLGPQFGPQEIKDVLDNSKLVYRYCAAEPELLDVAASLLERNRIVGWYQGRMEFGHRALGNRTDPRIAVLGLRPGQPESLHQASRGLSSIRPVGPG